MPVARDQFDNVFGTGRGRPDQSQAINADLAATVGTLLPREDKESVLALAQLLRDNPTAAGMQLPVGSPASLEDAVGLQLVDLVASPDAARQVCIDAAEYTGSDLLPPDICDLTQRHMDAARPGIIDALHQPAGSAQAALEFTYHLHREAFAAGIGDHLGDMSPDMRLPMMNEDPPREANWVEVARLAHYLVSSAEKHDAIQACLDQLLAGEYENPAYWALPRLAD